MVLLSGIVGQLSGVFDSANTLIGTEALPVPALLVFLPFAAAAAGVGALSRTRILSRAELLVVLIAALVATPLMTVGFWRFQLVGMATPARASDWIKLEALPDELWPHGKNLLEGALTAGAERRGQLLRVRVDLGAEPTPGGVGRRAVAVPGRPYLFSVRVRSTGLAPDARYFVRTYADDALTFTDELVSRRRETKASPLFPDGSERVGYYPFELPAAARRSVTFELGLEGTGHVEWTDLRLFDVRAIELAYKGFSRVTESEYGSLSLAERQSVLVVPDRLLSGAGVRYLLGLDYPIKDWLAPIARLGAFTLLVFGGTLALALLYRKQWLENERFSVPMLRPLLVLLGLEEESQEARARSRFWLWTGFGVAFVWCALRVARGYLPSLPDLSLSVGVKSYLSDAFWGRTWDDVKLEVYALFLGLGLLMDLKVLLSLVLGFLACRLQYCYGQAYGLASDYNFPHFPHQMLGAYLAYTGLTLALSRRYLAAAVRSALGGDGADEETRVQRVALGLLLACMVGFALWSSWVGIPLTAAGLLALHVLMLGFVAAKLRAECGLPRGGFNHPLGLSGNYNVALEPLLLVPLLGGLPVFGGSGLMTLTLVTSVLLPYGFFLVPGLQVEALELGRRFSLRTSHVAFGTILGVVLGIVVGGWVYLTAVYGFGANKFADAGQFGERLGAFRTFNAELAAAQSSPAEATSAADHARYLALGFGGVLTAAVTLLRQAFPGFWFHPIGLLAGPSDMMQTVWGSLLAAWLVRFGVLRLGGAATVREKLVPAAVGIFAASLCGHALYIALNAYWFFFHKGSVKFSGLL